ncbi:ABC transporter ATP-binding protein [Psychrosphaera haliotis]|uniref:ATP-binding cassette domain-containing protein n=1 Tax=Psychrosphaera haliotis TaxID=555083 RepID=A0A6N8F976_9GAMM|nr:ABC transporter ATP-binding protein [Psychrosphaera haliotis]MUH72808.1 ATP-binding cassette domain-containing protein [Psychrosphaera haliotis]
MIELKAIQKKYIKGKQVIDALNNINLRISKGQLLSITGSSGSGKSTLMNILGCIDNPSSGTYYLNGLNISEYNDKELSNLRSQEIGFVFQNFNLLDHLTAVENVMLPLNIKGVSFKSSFNKAMELIELVGLLGREHHTPLELSGGQQQRVAIARSLANNPNIILADEPTGNLDSKSSLAILDIFLKLNKMGKTIILITHEPEIAKAFDRNIVLSDGSMINEGE